MEIFLMKKIFTTTIWISFFISSLFVIYKVDKLYIYSKVPVTLHTPSFYLDLWDMGSIEFKGTLSKKYKDNHLNELSKQYFSDINLLQVECNSSTKQCTHTLAQVSETTHKPLLTLNTDKFRIHQWDKNIIIYGDYGKCYEEIFTFVKNTKIFTGIKKYTKDASCTYSEESIEYSLVDGFEVQFEKERSHRRPFLNFIIALALLFFSSYKIFRTYKPSRTNKSIN
jgi:hypothetical protein